jgi:hypothetical protein
MTLKMNLCGEGVESKGNYSNWVFCGRDYSGCIIAHCEPFTIPGCDIDILPKLNKSFCVSFTNQFDAKGNPKLFCTVITAK